MISSACTATITCEIIQKYSRLISNILRRIKGVRFKREDRKEQKLLENYRQGRAEEIGIVVLI